MTEGLKRYHHQGHLHFVTFSCFGRRPYLGTVGARDCFELALEAARVRYGFSVYAYVVMPEHVHMLVSEPEDLSKAMLGLKLSVAKRLPQSPFWQPRFYGFNVFTAKKIREKIQYIHENPAKRGLVPLAEMWRWSSLRQYLGESGVVGVETGCESG
jgi:putative transposase